MLTYVSLINWTDQGIRDFKESPARARATAELAESLGSKMVQLYWTVGQYDLVAVIESPDEETATATALAIGARGAVRTHTLRAFNAEEMARIIAKAG